MPFVSDGIRQAIPLICALWLVGVMLFSVRLILGQSYLFEIRRSLIWDVPEWLTTKMEDLQNELGIEKSIRIAISEQIISPLMMGFVKPIVIFPLSAINNLRPEEVELILKHEIGHILGNDYLYNIILRVIETIMFYHPCVWWTSHIIQKERENRCDDFALIGSRNQMVYAKTLVKIKELEAHQEFGLALGFSSNNKSLLNRIKRILNQKQKMSIMKGNLIVAIVLISSLFCISAGTYYFKSNKTTLPEKIESKKIMSFDLAKTIIPARIISKIDTLKKELSESKREELKEKEEKLRDKGRELRESMRELKQELREIHKGKTGHTFIIDSDEEWEEEFSEHMEEFGRHMEELGEHISEKFEDRDFDVHIADISDWGSDLGISIATSIQDALGEDFHKDMAILKTHLHELKGHDFDFDDLGEDIGEVVEDIVEGVFKGIEGLNHSFIYINPDKSPFVNTLLEELKDDGFYKNKKVNMNLEKNSLKINGRSQSQKMINKYKNIVSDYQDIDFESGHKFLFKQSDKKGKKKNSISIEKVIEN